MPAAAAGLKVGDRILSSGDGGGLPRGVPIGVAATGIDGEGMDLGHVTYFPTLAATAWYHGLVADKPASVQDDAG